MAMSAQDIREILQNTAPILKPVLSKHEVPSKEDINLPLSSYSIICLEHIVILSVCLAIPLKVGWKALAEAFAIIISRGVVRPFLLGHVPQYKSAVPR